MATGLIQQTALTSTTLTSVYSGVPAGKTATINILLCNTGANTATITLGLTTGTVASLTANSIIEYKALLPPGEVLERGGIVMAPTQYVYAQCDTTPPGLTPSVGCTITGYEV